jgi:hypothetical protein
LAPAQPPPDIVINEIMAENQTGIADEERDPEDWIELYNHGAEPVDLGGWSLSVDREEEGQWVFPPTIIPPGGFLVIWASGKDRREPATDQRFHTNFKLNPNGTSAVPSCPELLWITISGTVTQSCVWPADRRHNRVWVPWKPHPARRTNQHDPGKVEEALQHEQGFQHIHFELGLPDA